MALSVSKKCDDPNFGDIKEKDKLFWQEIHFKGFWALKKIISPEKIVKHIVQVHPANYDIPPEDKFSHKPHFYIETCMTKIVTAGWPPTLSNYISYDTLKWQVDAKS